MIDPQLRDARSLTPTTAMGAVTPKRSYRKRGRKV